MLLTDKYVVWALAGAYVAADRLDEAEIAADKSLEISEPNHYVVDTAQALLAQGQVRAARGQDAEEVFAQCIGILRDRGRTFELAGAFETYAT